MVDFEARLDVSRVCKSGVAGYLSTMYDISGRVLAGSASGSGNLTLGGANPLKPFDILGAYLRFFISGSGVRATAPSGGVRGVCGAAGGAGGDGGVVCVETWAPER